MIGTPDAPDVALPRSIGYRPAAHVFFHAYFAPYHSFAHVRWYRAAVPTPSDGRLRSPTVDSARSRPAASTLTAAAAVPDMPCSSDTARAKTEARGTSLPAEDDGWGGAALAAGPWRFCERVGMLADAEAGWRRISRRPFTACLLCVTATALASLVFPIAYIAGRADDGEWLSTKLSAIVVFVVMLSLVPFLWRYGPAAASTLRHKLLIGINTVPVVYLGFAPYIKGDSGSPYHSVFAWIIMHTVYAFLSNICAVTGSNELDCQGGPVPMAQAVWLASVRTLRIMDAITDLVSAKVLLTEVRHNQIIL
jgi:hypothetical protein